VRSGGCGGEHAKAARNRWSLFSCLGAAKINILAIAQGSSELNISMVIEAADAKSALNAIHSTFFTPADTDPIPSVF
jgi:bifunctional aspartokinase / homoserine dehydrogenase 1